MSTCLHERIVTYCHAETGKPVPLWACAECGRRFEPMDDGKVDQERRAEAELERLREIARKIERWVR